MKIGGDRGGDSFKSCLQIANEREIIYLPLHCHYQNDSYIKMGSDESHFNVSVGSDGQSHRTVSTNHNLFEVKGEPKWYRGQTSPPSGGRREDLSAFSVRGTKALAGEHCSVDLRLARYFSHTSFQLKTEYNCRVRLRVSPRVPDETKRREMELDPQVSPEEIMSREVELGCESWTSFASVCSSTAVQRTLSLRLPKHGS